MKKRIKNWAKITKVVKGLWARLLLLVALIIGLFFCYKTATRQISPELKQLFLSLNDTEITAIARIEMACMLFDKKINKKNEKRSIFAVSMEVYRDSTCLSQLEKIRLPTDYPYSDSSKIEIVNSLTFNSYDSSINARESDLEWPEESNTLWRNRSFQISPNEVVGELYQYKDCLTFAEIQVEGDNLWTADDPNNPYVNVYIQYDKNIVKNIENLSAKSYIGFAFWDKQEAGKQRTPVNFINIYPAPDNINLERFEYTTVESIKKAISDGIYFLAEDVYKKRISDKYIFVITLLLGVILSLIVTVITNIISTWSIIMKPIKKAKK